MIEGQQHRVRRVSGEGRGHDSKAPVGKQQVGSLVESTPYDGPLGGKDLIRTVDVGIAKVRGRRMNLQHQVFGFANLADLDRGLGTGEGRIFSRG